jgi:hypothetical protein
MKYGITVKTICSILIITLLIVVISFFSQRKLIRDSTVLGQSIEKIEESVESEGWDQAKGILKQISDDWMEVKGIWAALIDHAEIDNIDITLSRLEALIMIEDVSASLSEAAALRKYVNHIPNKEKLSFENVF